MKVATILCAVSLALAAGCSYPNQSTSNSGPDKTSLPNTPVPMSSPDQNSNSGMANANATTGMPKDFWTSAASGGMAEVELGRLASTKAQNPEVKRFAEMMVADHSKSNDELKALATRKNINLPTALDANHQSVQSRLQTLSGQEFDRAYVQAMVADHEATVQLFESQVSNNGDVEARSFAEKTLPTLRQHLEMIKQIQSKIK
ncbi:MAG TPA: DUF4142 domain-containing protein [Pyrinomonadaceae bacterium]|nr:DUF4142 domain-containing protein [Pyrinomonadaceae bacterium]